MSIEIIIPTCNPDQKFDRLIVKLMSQSVKPDSIMLINTKTDKCDREILEKRIKRIERKNRILDDSRIDMRILDIKPENFDHGGTRRFAASLSKADYMVFMTQDAIPADDYLLERLLLPFTKDDVAAVYARQLPSVNAGIVESFTRLYNYPEKDCIKTKDDIKTLGIKAYFLSDVCAAYNRKAYEAAGGFVKHTIFLEDMIIASEFLKNGFKIAYASNAKVIHSHSYTPKQQFKRNFDLGVSHKQYEKIFDDVPPAGEGMRLVMKTFEFLKGQGMYLAIIDLFINSAAKFMGYSLGRHYSMLPHFIVRKCTGNQTYFDRMWKA